MRILLAITALLFFGCATTTDPSSKILTYKEYANLTHGVPYILEFQVEDGALLLFGSKHTFDPNNLCIAKIKNEWERFNPTVAYNEGGNWPTADTADSTVLQSGESGLVRFLSDTHGVPVETFEPSDMDINNHLLEKYTFEQIKVFMALQSYLSFRQSKSEFSDEYFMNGILGKGLGIQGAPENIEELELSYKKLFPGESNWRDMKDGWFDPTQSFYYTNNVANDMHKYRDTYIFNLLVESVRNGERVFAVIGASHVPIMEPALIAAFGKPVRKIDGK